MKVERFRHIWKRLDRWRRDNPRARTLPGHIQAMAKEWASLSEQDKALLKFENGRKAS